MFDKSYQTRPTHYGDMRLTVHDRINDLHRRAAGIAPAVAESAADSGCTDKRPASGPRRQMAWDMEAEALAWNAISDDAETLNIAEACERADEPYSLQAGPHQSSFRQVVLHEIDAPPTGVPAELEMLRSLLDTAVEISDGARDELDALNQEYAELGQRIEQACERLNSVTVAEDEAYAAYRAALRERGYVQTASGPAPAPGRHELGAKTTFDAAVLPSFFAAERDRTPGPSRAIGTGGQAEIQCCGIWIDYPTPGRDEQCSACGSTFTVGTPA